MTKGTPKKKPPQSDVVRYTVGTGITMRPRVSVKVDLSRSLSPEAKSILNRENRYSRSRHGDIFNASIAGIEQSAKKILENAGLPSDPRKNYNINFDWNLNGELPDLSHLAACHQTKYPDGSLIDLVESRGYKEYSCIEWYAAKILSLINKVRHCIEQTLPADAAWRSLDLGFLINEGDWKNRFEKSILAHQKVEKGAADGGDKRGKQQTAVREPEWEKWQTTANEIWNKHPKWGKPAVAKMVQKKYPETSWETIKQRIKKPTP